ncbi:MAG: hypothetical protein ACE5MG_11725 [Candidatus Methylomirabilales bacterium]
MPSQIDIYRSAKLLIDQHGQNAARHAAKRADALLDAGDMEGRRAWLSILEAIEELRRTRLRGDEPMH